MSQAVKLESKKLQKLGISTIEELLYYFPTRYENRTVKPVSGLVDGEEAVVCGIVINVVKSTPRPKLKMLKAMLQDSTGCEIKATWFHDLPKINPGNEIAVFGKVKVSPVWGSEISVKDYITIDGNIPASFTGLLPVYPLTKGVSQKFIHNAVRAALHTARLAEFMPQSIRERYKLISLMEAMKQIHFPGSQELLYQAWRRLAFDELFLLQLALRVKRESVVNSPKDKRYSSTNLLVDKFIKQLPFQLTSSQIAAWNDIQADLIGDYPMRRLLLGDVGSGKTVVAALALLKAAESNLQGILMAPTGILAAQHYETLSKWFGDLGIKVALFTGGTKDYLDDAQVIIGTHALIQDGVRFTRPGIIVIDEQHRFGVEQRLTLQEKAGRPDMLVMTATPIPRTLALTAYGDMSLSVMDSMPPGRMPVKTYVTRDKERVKQFMYHEVRKGRQCYVICPLVEQSATLDLEDAVALHSELSREIQPYKVGLLHGRMRAEEKEEVMYQYKRGELHVLVSTTVIEVGVDVPNATVMVVTGADRFGLAQLHQLRGRVGRGDHQSYCILLAEPKTETAIKRLKAMVQHNNGFTLADIDLKLRGPGEFFGERQAGMVNFKLASLDNLGMVEAAKMSADEVEMTPELSDELERRFGNRLHG